MNWRNWLNWKYQAACLAACAVGAVVPVLVRYGHYWISMIPGGLALFVMECIGQKFRLAYPEQRCACGEINATVFDSTHGTHRLDGCEHHTAGPGAYHRLERKALEVTQP